MQRDICIDRLSRRALHHKEEPAYFSKKNQTWSGINWGMFHERVRQFSKSLLALDLAPDSKVAILGFNRLEWTIAALAAQYVGGVSVGIYTSSSAEEVFYVVDHSDAEILVVENLERFNKQVKPELAKLTKLKRIVLMSEEQSPENNVMKMSEFIALGKGISNAQVDQRFQVVETDAVATMIYTSGTTGNPKSVMLSHATVAWTVRTSVQAWRCGPNDRGISYLPLAHVAEQMMTVYAPLDCGMTCYFVESADKFKANLKEIEPTVFFGVPRVYEKIYEGIKLALEQKDAFTQKMLNYFSKVSTDYFQAHHVSKIPSFWTNIRYYFAHKKIFPAIRQQIGFGKCRLAMVGAAPISKEIMKFFTSIDIPIYEVYGQSENCGPTTLSLPGSAKIGSVGKPMPGAEVKIAADGEILIRGPHIFLGYYKDPKATAETVKDGWLYSGDVGMLDNDGFLSITDRKKDILITAGGKNISPQNIESLLKQLPYVQSAVVVGDNKKYLAALLSPDLDSIKKKASQLGISVESMIHSKEAEYIYSEINQELQKINEKLAPVEQIKKYKLLPHEFGVDSGEFTPTLKVKRKFVNQKYQREIAELY